MILVYREMYAADSFLIRAIRPHTDGQISERNNHAAQHNNGRGCRLTVVLVTTKEG